MTTLPRSLGCLNRGFVRSIDRDGAGFAAVADRLAPPGVGVADPEFRRWNGSYGKALVHCGGDLCIPKAKRPYPGELQRCLTAGQPVLHTPTNYPEYRRPRDGDRPD